MGFQLVKLIDPPVSITSNFNPMGAYSNSTAYVLGDLVTYNGLTYVANQSTTGNAPTNTTYWQLIYDDTSKFTTVHNGTGATIYKGTIVYLSGATGSNPNIVKAKADTDATSAQTFGVAYEDIANNSTGKVLSSGLVEGLDTRTSATHPFTSDTLAAGDILYLSPTTAGYVTNVKPSAPNHIVYVGFVVETSPTDGKIVYRIQNGYELDEIHDVSITSPANNDILTYESSSGLWKNKSGIDITAASSTSTPVIVRGASGQTANLTEWKDSSGNMLAKMSPAGALYFDGASSFRIGMYADAGGPVLGWGLTTQFDAYGRMDVSGGILRILGTNDGLLVTRSTDGVVQRVRGVSAQTGDLEQWQNSAGTVLARVTSAGGARFVPRVTTITSSATPTINTDTCDAVTITALATAITSMTTNLTGTPNNFDKLTIRIKDDGTARAITWGASFVASGVALPTTTTLNKVTTVGFIYDSVKVAWGCVACVVEL